MAWETRRRNGQISRGRYYTRSRWRDGRVMREYVGCEGSKRSQRAYWEDRQRHTAKVLAHDALERGRERCQAADNALAAYWTDIEQQLRTVLEAAGYHQHDRGEWRRRRGSHSVH